MVPETEEEKQTVIMVVDDEEVIRNMIRDFLATKGYQVILASEGLEAIEKFKQADVEIELVLLDMILPGISGTEIFKKLREINPQLKVIMTSGYNRDIVEDHDNEDSDISFLQKPFRFAELIDKMEEMISYS